MLSRYSDCDGHSSGLLDISIGLETLEVRMISYSPSASDIRLDEYSSNCMV